MFTVAAKPLGFGKGVSSGTIGEAELLAPAKNVANPTIRAKFASRSIPRLDPMNDLRLWKSIRHRRFSGEFMLESRCDQGKL